MSRTLQFLFVLCFSVHALSRPSGTVFAQGKSDQTGRVRVNGSNDSTERQQNVSPQLKQVLNDWYANTSKIERLEGSHSKYIYDFTFNVEKRAVGRFYYEAPDKGRIDIFPAKIGRGEESKRRGKSGKPFALQADRAEKWVANGKTIYQVDPVNKKALVYPIPPNNRGQNIMDGPLPFLLGMPPNKALQRYRLKVTKNTKAEVWLDVFPRWKSDAANYREAKVILQKDNHYLPSAVMMKDPSGHQETVYTFYNLKPNKSSIIASIFGKTPFEMDLKGYKVENMVPKGRTTQQTVDLSKRLPRLSGLPYKKAQQLLEKRGLKVEFVKGNIAQKQELVNHVQSQFPKAFTPFRSGQKVLLTLYISPRLHKPSEYKPVPNLGLVSFKEAKKKLTELGFKVELRKGSVTKRTDMLYRVQEQYPPAKSKAVEGTKIVLVLYVKPDDLKPKKRTAAKPQR